MKLTTDILWDLKRGRMGFDAFARECQGDFKALATKVASGWAMPPALHLDDLVQVMLMTVFTTLDGYDPKRAGLKEYVVFRACIAARRELRSNYNSKERDDLMPAECDVQTATQFDAVDATQRVQLALSTLPNGERQVAVLSSLARTQSLDATTDELLTDPSTRRLFMATARAVSRVSDETRKRTRHSVYRTALKLRDRAQTATA